MKEVLNIACILMVSALQAQNNLQNTGNLRIHKGGQIGFYVDLINDGIFDDNRGLAGFYGNNQRIIGGSLPTTFFDVEFMTENGTQLSNTVNIMNNANFIAGNVSTFREQSTVSVNFLADAFYSGEGNINKIDGYASVNGQQNFMFPVGDADQLRPLILFSEASNDLAKCAYFSENPNNFNFSDSGFDINSKAKGIENISNLEYWRLEGTVLSSVQLSWNEHSAISFMTNNFKEVVIVGWSKYSNQWEILGGTESVGDLTQGVAMTASFIPDDYEILTFGTSAEPRDLLNLDNYLITPNGDGINDFLLIPELDDYPNNHITIFDRNGIKVFDKANYSNEFNGISTSGNFVTQRKKGLPSGVYFYLVKLDNLNLEFQGYLYLARD